MRKEIFWVTFSHPLALGGAPILRNVKAFNRNDDPAGVHWIKSDDLVGFTYKMKNMEEVTDTAWDDFFEDVLYIGWPNQPSFLRQQR